MDTLCLPILSWHSVVCTFWHLGACCYGRHPYICTQTCFGLCCRDTRSRITGSEGHSRSGAQTPCQEGGTCLSIRGGWRLEQPWLSGPCSIAGALSTPAPCPGEEGTAVSHCGSDAPGACAERTSKETQPGGTLSQFIQAVVMLHSVCIHFLGHTKLPQICCLKTTEIFSFPALEARV